MLVRPFMTFLLRCDRHGHEPLLDDLRVCWPTSFTGVLRVACSQLFSISFHRANCGKGWATRSSMCLQEGCRWLRSGGNEGGNTS
jgi:hypothetical protein